MADAGVLPIKFSEKLSLPAIGIPASAIKFKNVTLESDKFVSVREDDQISIIDTETQIVTRLPVKVDSAIMNPVSKVIGLRAQQNNLQIYNLEMRSRMKVTQTATSVDFWKWLNPNTIAFVTKKSVFHWSMDGDAQPEWIFDRAEYDGQVQIINYRASADGQWLILGGITAGDGGTINGVLQLYSVARKKSQPTMNAHAGCFAHIKLDGRQEKSHLFSFTHKTATGHKLSIVEVGIEKEQAFKCLSDLRFANEQDFAVSMLADNKHGALFILTKAGYLFLYEIQGGKCLLAKRVSQYAIFASVTHEATGGIVTIDQNGRMLLFNIDEENLVPYITEKLQDFDLGVRMAARYNLPGAENVFQSQFDKLMVEGDYSAAAKLAVDAPQGVLRTMETMKRFQAVRAPASGPAPVLQYFSLLLKKGKLNKVESIELARPVLKANTPAGRKHIEDWIKEEKLEYSEDLGDLLRTHDLKLACSVYLRAKCPEKAIGCFLQLGQFSKIIAYSKSVNFKPDYTHLVTQLHRVNREQAKEFALSLCHHPEGALLDIKVVVDIFMRANDVETTTSFLLDILKIRGDREEDSEFQTQLLTINLMSMPQVADAIMESEEFQFTHYDKLRIAQLCERANLFQRALEHYEDLEDIKRCLQVGLGNNALSPEFILKFFGDMTPEDGLECLRDLLKYNMSQNIRLVVDVAKRYSDQLTSSALISLFEEFESNSGLYYYLGSFVNYTEDPAVVFKYIEAATKLDQHREVERICRENDHYDPERVKSFLLEVNMKDPRPLIYVCDRHGFVEELTNHLYSKNMYPFIEAYVQKMNPSATPKVVGALLDLNAQEDQVRDLFSNVRPPQCPVKELVEEVEKRNRLRLLLPWLEARMHEGLQDVALHNALAKVYVEINNNPQQFLINNQYYDSREVGKFCESRDPHLSFIAYKRAWGECDKELVEVTNKHGFFKDQARYLVERQDESLWETVLNENNEFRRQLIDQVVASALVESRIPEEVSTTVKAFMAADLPNELIELLERIVLHGSSDREFHNNRNLQNLLILTAIKADPQRVMDYLNRLDNYDGPDIAKIAISDQYRLYEEAFFIYKKFEKGEDAINVLINNLEELPRAVEFAAYRDKPEVWSILGHALLADGRITESIDAFLKADDAKHYEEVITAAGKHEKWDDLIRFLSMARKNVREAAVDNELIFAYAKTNRLADLEDFIAQPNVAKLEDVGFRCFNEELYEPARIIYDHTGNYGQLALCLVHLEQFQLAVDAARKANSIPTWKAVCYACVDANEFRLAQMCALNIIIYMDHLQDLIHHYEVDGHFDHIIAVAEQGINLDRAHQGIYTELGILYAKYKEEKLMEHISLFYSRLNIPTLISTCKQCGHWPEAVFLYTHYDQYDNAIEIMIDHSASCWKNDLFKEIIVKVSNTEVFYRASNFYLREHPLLLNDLLIELSGKLDHARMVNNIKQQAQLPLIQKYLLYVQRENIALLNECVNQLYVDEENYAGLRESIDAYHSFDHIALAQQIENHTLLEFRRIAAHIYRLNKRFKKSIDLSKTDELWQDATETAAASCDPDVTEDLLRFLVQEQDAECFAACLFTCYEFVRPDVVLELAWRHNLMNFAMPFMIQTFQQFESRINELEKVNSVKNDVEKEKDKEEAKQSELQMQRRADLMGPNPTLAIASSAHWQPHEMMGGGATGAGMHMAGNMPMPQMSGQPYGSPVPQQW
uniref:Clathrin heavy chain n=1 Tax=Hirondellea gigas TaxID=1518452 RepID=A0A6A7FZ08_9CRUS